MFGSRGMVTEPLITASNIHGEGDKKLDKHVYEHPLADHERPWEKENNTLNINHETRVNGIENNIGT